MITPTGSTSASATASSASLAVVLVAEVLVAVVSVLVAVLGARDLKSRLWRLRSRITWADEGLATEAGGRLTCRHHNGSCWGDICP